MRSASIRLPGHPDAACDIVAETIVDEYLRRDPETRIRVSVTGGRGAMFISGDVLSTADFDVSAVVIRALGSLGVMTDMEPFISLEPVAPEQVAAFQRGSSLPVCVYGYATNESDELLPQPVHLARRIGKNLEDLRSTREEWFWLGADGEVSVHADSASARVSLCVEQGTKSLAEAREMLAKEIGSFVQSDKSASPISSVETNALGSNDARGLAHAMGASGRGVSLYGMNMPAVPGLIGSDCRSPQKAGAWLARAAARLLVVRGAKAAMVQLVFEPGDFTPSYIRARDEQGKDISHAVIPALCSLDRVMREWWRPGLGVDAARWGFVGESGLPWES